MLPRNRKEVFFDVLRLQWRSLLLLGLILLLFALPLLLSSVVRDVYVSNFLAALEGTGAEQQPGAGYALAYWEIARSLVNILFLVVFSVALAGVSRVLRQYAWGENVHIPTDFAKGVKDNSKQMALLGFFTGLIFVLCLVVLYFSSSYQSGFLASLSLLPIAITLLLILPLFFISMVMIPVYSNPFGITLKNAFYIFTRVPFQTLLFLVCCAVIWIPALLPNLYCHLIGGAAALLLTPFVLLAWTLFCYHQFDRFINRSICPELVNKGIFQGPRD